MQPNGEGRFAQLAAKNWNLLYFENDRIIDTEEARAQNEFSIVFFFV